MKTERKQLWSLGFLPERFCGNCDFMH